MAGTGGRLEDLAYDEAYEDAQRRKDEPMTRFLDALRPEYYASIYKEDATHYLKAVAHQPSQPSQPSQNTR